MSKLRQNTRRRVKAASRFEPEPRPRTPHSLARAEVIQLDSEMPLDRLALGRAARVTRLTAGGALRRRMLDLGIVEGTVIEPLFRSPSGSPVAYRIRGAVIALRADASGNILVSPSPGGE